MLEKNKTVPSCIWHDKLCRKSQGLYETNPLWVQQVTGSHDTRLTYKINFIANHISDKRLIFRVYRELLKLNKKKNEQLIQKWAKDWNRHFSKEDIHTAG